MPSSPTSSSPWQQASSLAFRAVYLLTLLAAVAWLFSNVRQIGPDSRAMVVRMGVLERVANPGLLLAWPRPFEHVLMLPAPERVLERRVSGLLRSPEARQQDLIYVHGAAPLNDAFAGSGFLLTGDAAMVALDVRVFYTVTDPYAYVLQGEHVLPALDRVVTRSTLALCAARDLDTILVARPERLGADHQAALARERLRGDLVHAINQQLARLSTQQVGLGVHVTRIDVQASLPPSVVSAFDAVLTASQLASQHIANARTTAARKIQSATQAADRTLQIAHAQASERVAQAQANTASVNQLASTVHDGSDPGLLWRLYRERMPKILAQAGTVTTVDPKDDSHLIIPGAEK